MSRASISNNEERKHQIPLSTLYKLTKILKKDIFFALPTYKEVEDKMTSIESTDIESLLTNESLDNQLKSELENIIKEL